MRKSLELLSVSKIRRNSAIVSRLTFVLSWAVLFASARQDSPWQLNAIYETRANTVIPMDLDDDGIDEIIECVSTYAYVRSQTGTMKKQLTFNMDRFLPLCFYDLDRDGEKDIFFGIFGNDTVFLSRGTSDKQRIFHGKDIRDSGPRGYDGSIDEIHFQDINNDGHLDIICAVSTGFDLSPRGIIAYDWHNRCELWHYWLSTCPVPPLKLVDVNNDGRDEIFIGTFAPCNGVMEKEIDDFQSWVVALDLNGNLLWQKQIGDQSTLVSLWVGDINRDDKHELVACEIIGLEQTQDPNSIWLLDAASGKVTKYLAAGEKFLGLIVDDYDRDGKLDIVTGNTDGVLRILNAGLETTTEKEFNAGIALSHIADIDGNGTKEIILTSEDGSLIILNEKLEQLLNYRSPHGKIGACRLARQGKKYNIITYTNIGFENICQTLAVKKSVAVEQIQWHIILVASGLLLISVLIFALYNKNKSERMFRGFIDIAPMILIILSRKNKFIYGNKKATETFGETKEKIKEFLQTETIAHFLKNVPGKTLMDFQYNDRHYELRSFEIKNKKMLTMRDKTLETTSRDLISWSGVAQKLAHDIKNPLSTINLTLQRLQTVCRDKLKNKVKDIDLYIESMLEEIERIRRSTDQFMKILSFENPKPETIQINRLLDRILHKHLAALPPGIVIQKKYAGDLPAISADQGQLTTAFLNILDNAVEAVETAGTITIRANTFDQVVKDKARSEPDRIKKYVEIRIDDTGRGISPEDQKNLFTPFFSTKKQGTGLGLLIARRIIAAHAGTIEVKSTKNIGTSMIILLPAETSTEKLS